MSQIEMGQQPIDQSIDLPHAEPTTSQRMLLAITFAYVFLIIVSEGLGALLGPTVGLLGYAIVLHLLLLHYHLTEHRGGGLFLTMGLLPLARMLSLAMIGRPFPVISWYLLVGIPLGLGALLVARRLGRSGRSARAQSTWLQQASIGLLGLPLGLVVHFVHRPAPLVSIPDPLIATLALLSLFLFAAVEEWIFRGLIQSETVELFGTRGVLVAGLIATSMYVGTLSLSAMFFGGFVAFLFGVIVRRTGRLSGVTVARTLLYAGALILWPLVLG